MLIHNSHKDQDDILSESEDAGKLEGPADRLDERIRIQNNISNLDYQLISMKCSVQLHFKNLKFT